MAFRLLVSKLNPAISRCATRIRDFGTSSVDYKRVAFNLSDIGEGIREVVVKEWFVKEGDTVEQFDNLCEVQSDKASVTITSRYDGKIWKLHHQIDETLVGKPLVDFDVIDELAQNQTIELQVEEAPIKTEPLTLTNEPKSIPVISDNGSQRMRFLATPAVRRIAGENQVNLAKVKATGRFGRILKGDVIDHLNGKTEIVAASTESTKSAPIVENDRVEQLNGVQKAMFKSMTKALKIPHFSYSDEINVTNLVQLRESLKPEAESLGVRLTFMPFFIKAASIALNKFPILNSVVDEENEVVIYKSAHNISIAMATKNGLVVPNVKNCEQKSIRQIANDLNEMLERGRNGQLQPNDFANGTFSLSNIGVIGGTYTKPVIAAPQVAIGAIGKTQVVPRFVDDSDRVERAHIINVSWSADHRVIDGVTMASFSNEWKRLIENHFILQ